MSPKRVIVTPEFQHFPTDWHLSTGVDDGDYVFFSGVTGTHPDLSVADDPETQFRDTIQFLERNLAQAELKFDDVVEMTTYHVGSSGDRSLNSNYIYCPQNSSSGHFPALSPVSFKPTGALGLYQGLLA